MDKRLWNADCGLPPAGPPRRAKASACNLQSAICTFKLAIPVLLALDIPATAAASDDFPRGDGFYFSIAKLVTLLVAYLCWVATCRWVDKDATDLDLPVTNWSTMLFGAGFFGLVIVWLLPWYWISFVLLIVLYLTASLAYVNLRNQKVSAELRVLTARHLRELAERYLKLRFGRGDEEDASGVAVEFIGKSRKGDDDAGRVARVASSKG